MPHTKYKDMIQTIRLYVIQQFYHRFAYPVCRRLTRDI